jgi:hypothetical protein
VVVRGRRVAFKRRCEGGFGRGQRVLVSAVNGWEVAIKTRLGKLPLEGVPEAFMAKMLARHRIAARKPTSFSFLCR